MAFAYGLIATGGLLTLSGLVTFALGRNALHSSARI
jgi:hypothetical protein